jgi:hypothetical protein
MIEIIKAAASQAVDADAPVKVVTGMVISEFPLKIYVDQKITLDESSLVLTDNVRDHDTEVTVAWISEIALESTTHAHTHNITGRKSITVHKNLKMGENVVMLRFQGGQCYLVIDRV